MQHCSCAMKRKRQTIINNSHVTGACKPRRNTLEFDQFDFQNAKVSEIFTKVQEPLEQVLVVLERLPDGWGILAEYGE